MDYFCIGNDARSIPDVNEPGGVRGCGWVGIEVGRNGREIRAGVRSRPSTWAGGNPISKITDYRM